MIEFFSCIKSDILSNVDMHKLKRVVWVEQKYIDDKSY